MICGVLAASVGELLAAALVPEPVEGQSCVRIRSRGKPLDGFFRRN